MQQRATQLEQNFAECVKTAQLRADNQIKEYQQTVDTQTAQEKQVCFVLLFI